MAHGQVVEEDPLPELEGDVPMIRAVDYNEYNRIRDFCRFYSIRAAARMTDICSEYNIPQQAVDDLVSLMKQMIPVGEQIMHAVDTTSDFIHSLNLPHTKIDVCPNGCMLFWKEAEELKVCDICKEDRSEMNPEGELIAKKVLTYFPITPRLQRLYACTSTAEDMTYSSRSTKWANFQGLMSYPYEGQAWKAFDATYPQFAAEPRNVRLALYTDGFNPFGRSGKGYSCWPVMVAPYNLTPALLLKNKYMFMSLIIPGPKSPKDKLDVYLQPVIEELKQLWDNGAWTYDAFRKQNFKMHAAVIWTISGFSAYGMLSGWRTQGKLACPYCMENTKSSTLDSGNKYTWFDCHRQFLPHDHVFRKNKSDFTKNRVEKSPPPPRLSGDQIWDRVSGFPKTTDCRDVSCMDGVHNWTKQSIFWELPYWRKLLVRHTLDVMDIEKGFFDQIMHAIMDDDKGKPLDTEDTREDLSKSSKRQRLQLDGSNVEDEIAGDAATQVPPYVLNEEKRKALCKWIQELKFPDGYPFNLRRYVNLQEGKISNMQTHDSHVFMERLLPVALRELLPVDVWNAITELSQFFRDISRSPSLTRDVARLERNIPEILCKLERIFPPAFFGILQHMTVHLPYEAKVCGPMQYRSKFPFERFLRKFKGKMVATACVEDSLCDAYLAEETRYFCNYYAEPLVDTTMSTSLQDHEGDPLPGFDEWEALHGDDDEFPGFFFYSDPQDRTVKKRLLDVGDYRAAHLAVLECCEPVNKLAGVYAQELIKQYPEVDVNDIWNCSKFTDTFPEWLQDHVLSLNIPPSDPLWTAVRFPGRYVRKYNRFLSQGYEFHTYSYGKDKPTMNYGVYLIDDKDVEYYGIIQEIIELTYQGRQQRCRAAVFKCDWFETGNNLKVHPLYKLVEINFTKKKRRNYVPFVVAYGLKQVCYTPYPSINNERGEWWAVFDTIGRATGTSIVHRWELQGYENRNPPLLSEPALGDQGDAADESEEEDGDKCRQVVAVLEGERVSEDSDTEFMSEMDDELVLQRYNDNNDAGKGESDSSEADFSDRDDSESELSSG